MLQENIRNLRKAKGWSQEELAIKLNVVRQTVSNGKKEFLLVKDTTPDITTPRLYIPILRKRVP